MTSAIRTGQAQAMDRQEFGERFRQRFVDPAFDAERAALKRLEEIGLMRQGDEKLVRPRPK